VQPGGIPYAGIEVAAGSNGVTVENCTVLHYEWGIYVVSATHTLLTHNVAMGNPAFWVKGGSFNSLTSNTALNVDEPPCCYYIGAAGFVLSSTSSDTLSGNSAVGTFTGYYLASSNSNSLTGNTANAFCCGYTLDASSYNTIQGNKENGVLGSEVCFVASFGFSATDYSSYNNFVNNWVGGVGDGYFVSSSSSNSFRSNTATLTCNGFEIDSGSSNRLVSNVANLNDRNGFYLPGGASKNVMLLNTADGNSGNGFQLSAGTFSNKVFENKANGNSGYGYYDGSLGHETAGTANRYIADSCFGDLTAGSSPSGLCI
jgi:parallel beta-helix repeat protein